MGRDQWPDLSVKIGRHRRRLVPDADVCLAAPGAALLARLARHVDICLTPEFLAILDNWILYDREPELLRPAARSHRPADRRSREREAWAADDVRQSLRVWGRLRDAGLLHWLRDAPHDSCLPPGLDGAAVRRWEAMAEALDARLPKADDEAACGPMIAAARDVAALVAVYEGAVALCRRDPEEPTLPPRLCRHLADWRLPCRHVRGDDEMAARDRHHLVDLMVDAGLASFLWGGERLAVVHLMVPGEAGLRLDEVFGGIDEDPALEPRPARDAWEGAQVFWYDLAAETGHAA